MGENMENQTKHVWSDYCSHQRLFTHIADRPGADYILVFEDDVVVSSQHILSWVHHTIRRLPPSPFLNWGVIQIEAFGQELNKHIPLVLKSGTHESSLYVSQGYG